MDAARARINQQTEELHAAGLLRYPRLKTEVKYNRLDMVTPQKQRYLGDSRNDFQADVVLRQLLYSGGAITAEKEAALFALQTVKEEYRVILSEAVFRVKTAYYKLINTIYILENKKVLLNSTQWFYETALELNKKTKTPREETLLHIEVQLNRVKQDVITAEANLKNAQKNLLAAMGLDISGDINIVRIPFYYDKEKFFEKKIMVNPEVKVLENKIKHAQAGVKSAESEYFPRAEAFLSYGYEWPGFETGGRRWSAGVNVDFTLWDWGLRKIDVIRAKERERELEANKKTLINRLKLEYESGRQRYEAAVAKFEIASENLELARRSLKMFKKRYENTTATSQELLEAQKALIETETDYASALLDLRIAAAEIEKITGVYFENK